MTEKIQAHTAPSRRDLFMMTPPIIVGFFGLTVFVAGRLYERYTIADEAVLI
jgi:hypothetical protein